MTKEKFEKYKQDIIELVQDAIKSSNDRNDFELYSLKKTLDVLMDYNYENRIVKKGLITRVIIDSLELDYNIGEKIIDFDTSIS